MSLGYGAAGKAGIKKEADWGTAVTVDAFIELITESVKSTIEMIPEPQVFGSRNINKYQQGMKDIGGPFQIVANPDNIGLLMYMALGVEGNATQVGATTAYDHDFTPAAAAVDLGSFTLEVEREIDCSTYAGMTVNSMTLAASKGSLVTADFDCVGKVEVDGVSAQTLTSSTKVPYTFHMGSVEIDDTAETWVNSWSLTYNNHIDTEGGFVLAASQNRQHAYKTIGSLTGSMEIEWTSDSDDLRDAYLANTQKKLELFITSTEAIESGYYYTITIEIPKIHILGDPPVITGRERTPFTVNWEAAYDSTNFIKVTLRDALSSKWSA